MSGDALPARHYAWCWVKGSEPGDLLRQQLPLPSLGTHDVLVRNAVIGLNPVDWKVLGGELVDWQPGHVPGVDGAGTVVAIGTGVAPHWLGQRVAYHQSLQRSGSFAEFTALANNVLIRVPDNLDLATAASLPCPALTASLALDKLPLRSGQSLLIGGAGGAVGLYLAQLAIARGLSVTALCNERHWQRLLALGVSTCLPGPLQTRWDLDERFNAVIDCVGAAHAEHLAPALRANGHLVCIQGRLEHWPCPPFGRTLSLHEVALGALHVHGDSIDWQYLTAVGERLLADLSNGRLHAEALHIAPFADLPRHLEALRQRKLGGKLLVSLSS